jgi:hypothetical protein
MQKMIWTPSESTGANSETPNHAFALEDPLWKMSPMETFFNMVLDII